MATIKESNWHVAPLETKQTDLLIIGAGCSGLALARELSERQWFGSITLLDQRTTYSNDRTWCFWENSCSPWSRLATNHWYQWSMSASGETHSHKATEVAYCRLQASDYYQVCFKLLQNNPNLVLDLGRQIYNIDHCHDHGYLIQTDHNNYQASIVVDTRPSTIQMACLYQCFYGVELDTDWYKVHSSDPNLINFGQALTHLYLNSAQHNTVGLMQDIQVDPQFNATVFQYFLPLTNNKWLIERTWFSPTKLSQSRLQECWQQYMCRKIADITHLTDQQCRKILKSYWSDIVLRDEYGCLPMGIKDPSNRINCTSENFIYGGIAGDLLRPATGYGFLEIQSWATELAQNIMLGPLLKHRLNKRKSTFTRNINNFLDRVFLHVIHKQPKLSPKIFMTIMNSTTAVEFSKFMSNQPKLGDWWCVIKSVPKTPFIIGFIQVLNIYMTDFYTRIKEDLAEKYRATRYPKKKKSDILRYFCQNSKEQRITEISTSDDRP